MRDKQTTQNRGQVWRVEWAPHHQRRVEASESYDMGLRGGPGSPGPWRAQGQQRTCETDDGGGGGRGLASRKPWRGEQGCSGKPRLQSSDFYRLCACVPVWDCRHSRATITGVGAEGGSGRGRVSPRPGGESGKRGGGHRRRNCGRSTTTITGVGAEGSQRGTHRRPCHCWQGKVSLRPRGEGVKRGIKEGEGGMVLRREGKRQGAQLKSLGPWGMGLRGAGFR